MLVKTICILSLVIGIEVHAEDFSTTVEQYVNESNQQVENAKKSLKVPETKKVEMGITIEDIQAGKDRADKMAKTMKVEDVKTADAIGPDALKGLDKAVERELERQKKTFLGSSMAKDNPYVNQSIIEKYQNQKIKVGQGQAFGGERIYILLSSSMPERTVRNYLKSIHLLKSKKVIPVIRGLIKQDIKETLIWTTRVILKDPKCRHQGCEKLAPLMINPLPFRDFKVDRVPAIVWTNKRPQGKGMDDNDYLLIQGDVSLEYALRKFAEEKPTSISKQLLKRKK